MRERNAMQVAYARTKGKGYAETFRCPGGALCLDFCNSGQGIRGFRQEEWIPTYADLVVWLEAAEALTESQALRLRTGGAQAPQAAQQLFERAIAFREALARVLLARAESRAAAREDLGLIEAVPGRNEELQPPLVRDGELRQPHEGAAPPREAGSKRLSQAKNSRYHRREFCGLRIQWFSSGK